MSASQVARNSNQRSKKTGEHVRRHAHTFNARRMKMTAEEGNMCLGLLASFVAGKDRKFNVRTVGSAAGLSFPENIVVFYENMSWSEIFKGPRN